ncbi:hypothetical protein DFP73DRAFT_249290 [Morchella snyderi]|nr:hypothetical protein DFP73DRAFT_249290 [Morchella snyderi]
MVKQSPSIVAMPWNGFRFLLQIPLNNIGIVENILLALEYIAHTLGRCAIYERLYLMPSNQTISARNIRAALPDLYAAILTYLSESKKHFTQNLTVRTLHSTWDPYILRFKLLIYKIKEGEATVKYNVSATGDEGRT